jgi:hypothetical protein
MHHYIEEAQNGAELKKDMTIVVQIGEDNKVMEWLSRKIIRIICNAHKVEHFEEVDLATMCKSCYKHGHGAHNCPSPNNPQCGICKVREQALM